MLVQGFEIGMRIEMRGFSFCCGENDAHTFIPSAAKTTVYVQSEKVIVDDDQQLCTLQLLLLSEFGESDLELCRFSHGLSLSPIAIRLLGE